MKLIDEQGRVFGKINVFDLIVIMVLVLGLAFIMLRPTAGKKKEEELSYQSAVYTMEIEGVRDYIAAAYKEEDPIYEGTTEIGVIKKMKVTPQKVVRLQPDGSYKEVERKLYYTIELTLETDDYYENEGQFVDGKGMLCGTSHAITNGIVNNDAVVLSIKVIED